VEGGNGDMKEKDVVDLIKEMQKAEKETETLGMHGAFDTIETTNEDGKVIQIMGDKTFEVEI
jgi:hypothetical protein